MMHCRALSSTLVWHRKDTDGKIWVCACCAEQTAHVNKHRCVGSVYVCIHQNERAHIRQPIGPLPLFLLTKAEIKLQKQSWPHARQYWPQMCLDRSQRKRDGISSRCGCVFLNFEVNMIWHEKMLCSYDSHGLNNRAHTYCMPDQNFFCLSNSLWRSQDI